MNFTIGELSEGNISLEDWGWYDLFNSKSQIEIILLFLVITTPVHSSHCLVLFA